MRYRYYDFLGEVTDFSFSRPENSVWTAEPALDPDGKTYAFCNIYR